MSYSPFRFLPSLIVKNKPIHLTLFLTRRCNQRCPFCFYLSGKADENGSELSLEEISRISASMGNLLWLAFSGGEIFLREDIFEITKTFYSNNKPSIILYPTNGMMPTVIEKQVKKILSACPKSAIVVKLSLDGIGANHDTLRGSNRSFENVIETCKRLVPLSSRYSNFELGINTVFCSENQDEMPSIIEFVKLLPGIKTHTISLVRGNERLKKVDISKYFSAIKLLEENLKTGKSPIYGFSGSRIKAAQDILQRRIIYKTIRERKIQIPCFAGRLNIVITESGDVFPCESFSMKMGNIRDFNYDINALLGSPAAKKIKSGIKENRCYCSHECYVMTNILFNPATYPSLMKEFFALRPGRGSFQDDVQAIGKEGF